MRRNAVAGRCIVHAYVACRSRVSLRSLPLVCTSGVPCPSYVNFVLQYEEGSFLDVVIFVTGDDPHVRRVVLNS